MSWKKICSLSELGERQIAEFHVDGIRVAVVRGDDHIVVIPPLCPHLAESLRQGFCDGRTLTCYKHLWQWDLETGNPLAQARKPLKRYLSKVQGDDIVAFVDHEIVYEYE